jgi:putative spermidine/putrescine transport system substrate-binding protein
MILAPLLALALAAAGPQGNLAGKPAAKPGGKPVGKAADTEAAVPVAAFAAALPPSAPRDAVRRVLLKPYAGVAGAALADVVWDGADLAALKVRPPDLVLASAAQVQAGCKSQQFARLDWGRLNRDRFVPQAALDCGAGAYVAASGLAWDKDKLNFTPNWGDFWDVARHPGRRGLQKTARGNLEYALLADGVSAGDVYRTLRTADGVDRAFRKLDQLKPYLTWWDKPEQPGQMLAAGKVLMTSAPAAAVLQAGAGAHKHFGVQWAGSLFEVSYWAVPAGAAHPAQSALALLVALDPARLDDFFAATFLGPPTRDALELLPEAARAGAASANLAGGLAVDDGFWAENQARLEPRFAAWLAK